MGVAHQLQLRGQRLAQASMSDLCKNWPLEFAIHAGATIEYLAKAVVAQDNFLWVFRNPLQLTRVELAVLSGPGARPKYGVANSNDLEKARRLVWNRQTIGAKSAVRFAAPLVRDGGRKLDVAAANSTIDLRNQAIHLGDLHSELEHAAARSAVEVAEALWSGLPSVLWGHFTHAVEILGRPDPLGLRWATARRIALAHERHALQGIVSNSDRRKLVDAEPTADCPVCRGRAHLAHRNGPGPIDTAAWASHARILVFTCLGCGLELYGEEQIEHGGISLHGVGRSGP